MSEEKADIIIVGAGLAGLAAADRLTKSLRTVIVLEARNRLGGRIFTKDVNGRPFDFGAQWIGPQQKHVNELAGVLGLEVLAQYDDGKKQYEGGGTVLRYKGNAPPLPLFNLMALRGVTGKIEKLVKEVKGDGEKEGERMRNKRAFFDAMTWQQWCDENIKERDVRGVIDCATRNTFAAEPGELSLYHVLRHFESGAGVWSFSGRDDGDSRGYFEGGAKQLAEKLSERVRQRGTDIWLNAAAARVDQDDSHVTVSLTGGHEFVGRAAILAMPPALAQELAFTPPVTVRAANLRAGMTMGAVVKFVVCYETPFWRSSGLSGEFMSESSPIRYMADATPPDKAFGALVGFLLGESARQATERGYDVTLNMIARELARLYGRAAEQPIAFDMHDWAEEPLTRGGYAAAFPQGVLSTPPPVVINTVEQDPMLDAYGVLRTPHGRVFFAGTETARVNMGYMDGAVESGWRAADEVLAMLG